MLYTVCFCNANSMQCNSHRSSAPYGQRGGSVGVVFPAGGRFGGCGGRVAPADVCACLRSRLRMCCRVTALLRFIQRIADEQPLVREIRQLRLSTSRLLLLFVLIGPAVRMIGCRGNVCWPTPLAAVQHLQHHVSDDAERSLKQTPVSLRTTALLRKPSDSDI